MNCFVIAIVVACIELRLVEAVEVSTERLPSACQSRLHGSVQPRPHHVHLRTATGNEEAGAGRKRVQGTVVSALSCASVCSLNKTSVCVCDVAKSDCKTLSEKFASECLSLKRRLIFLFYVKHIPRLTSLFTSVGA